MEGLESLKFACAYEATGFIGRATSVSITIASRGIMILIGIIAAVVIFAQRRQIRLESRPE